MVDCRRAAARWASTIEAGVDSRESPVRSARRSRKARARARSATTSASRGLSALAEQVDVGAEHVLLRLDEAAPHHVAGHGVGAAFFDRVGEDAQIPLGVGEAAGVDQEAGAAAAGDHRVFRAPRRRQLHGAIERRRRFDGPAESRERLPALGDPTRQVRRVGRRGNGFVEQRQRLGILAELDLEAAEVGDEERDRRRRRPPGSCEGGLVLNAGLVVAPHQRQRDGDRVHGLDRADGIGGPGPLVQRQGLPVPGERVTEASVQAVDAAETDQRPRLAIALAEPLEAFPGLGDPGEGLGAAAAREQLVGPFVQHPAGQGLAVRVDDGERFVANRRRDRRCRHRGRRPLRRRRPGPARRAAP